MKLYLVVTAFVTHPWELPSVALYWTLRAMHLPGLGEYYWQMTARTYEALMVTIPALVLCVLAKKFVLEKLVPFVRVKVIQARIS